MLKNIKGTTTQLRDKLQILAGGAKYEVSCSALGAKKRDRVARTQASAQTKPATGALGVKQNGGA